MLLRQVCVRVRRMYAAAEPPPSRAAGCRSCSRLSATISNINDHQPTYYYPTAAGLTETLVSFGIFSFGYLILSNSNS